MEEKLSTEHEVFDSIIKMMQITEDWKPEDYAQCLSVSMSLSTLQHIFSMPKDSPDGQKLIEGARNALKKFAESDNGITAVAMMVKLGGAFFNSEILRRGGAKKVFNIPQDAPETPPAFQNTLREVTEDIANDLRKVGGKKAEPKTTADWMQQFGEKHKRN